MTALDPSPIIARLRDQKHCTGVYDPTTVEELIATTERTGELPVVGLPFPRGGRSLAPAELTRYGAGAPALALVSDLCGERHPTRVLLCGGVRGHAELELDHVAYGDGREIARWSVSGAQHRRVPALPSADRQNAHHWRTGEQ